MQKISLLAALLLFAATAFATTARKAAAGKVRPETKRESTRTKPISRRQPVTNKLTGLHPQAQRKLKAAIKDMRAIGVRPTVTSAYRSSAQQQKIYRCSHQRRCRARRGIFSAHKPGASLHEAGLAVDFASVAYGKKRQRRLTRDGKKMIKVMRRHGFRWRYGLKDPAHFELEPRMVGYKSEKHAIAAAQRREARPRATVKKPARAHSKARRRA
jgi:LAS superfamily LD-carboxypeptidase LdcB